MLNRLETNEFEKMILPVCGVLVVRLSGEAPVERRDAPRRQPPLVRLHRSPVCGFGTPVHVPGCVQLSI